MIACTPSTYSRPGFTLVGFAGTIGAVGLLEPLMA
jgi:hypothetical protein